MEASVPNPRSSSLLTIFKTGGALCPFPWFKRLNLPF